ncbi:MULTISPECIES: RluA family pseudouridine synthase [Solibacillus]|uniref:Pseudouridine synthase n=1 Tax=Solibacillus merdavium TaxID=2762218 RepID=A0ABR8XHW2_9BACL|nr:RluA family pseudouridine synthase [Solibacillus merdavium]MBD8031525.1 RluA family pseudouridine synthase [Solibacillus merdavium]
MDKRFQLQFVNSIENTLLRDAIAQWGISKRALTAIKFDGGELLVNGEEKNVRHKLKIGDVVTIIFPQEEVSEGLAAQVGALAIVYEDEALLILDKPSFMNSIPSREQLNGSIANYVYGYFVQQQLASTVHIVTRLDRDTSGLMVIAKHRHIHHIMSGQQKNGCIHREYEAIVEGYVEQDQQSIILPIGRKDTSIIEREVRADGQFAHTDVSVIARKNNMSHIRLKLHTGRTHQIRVHMAHIGHPLVGDELYGGSRKLINRQALHCRSIQFEHPLTKENMHFCSKLPTEISSLII